MAEGRIVAEGPPEDVMADQAVIDAYLGAHHDTDLGDDALLDDGSIEQLQAEEQANQAAAAAAASPTTEEGSR
jgi:branched-chain amino acid transport system ATP-binding protein